MQVLKLIKQNNCLFDYRLGQELGDGSDGQCFDLLDHPNKVIKLGVAYQYDDNLLETVSIIENVCKQLILKPSPVYGNVFDFQVLGQYSRNQFDGSTQSYILYYYLMEKLLPISMDERKVFHSILSHEDSNKRKDFSLSKCKTMLQGLAKGLDFDQDKVLDFYIGILNSPVIQRDIHVRNIMKNHCGNFKLIDLDRCNLRS